MSLETVVEDIRDEARARAEEIRSAAQQEADDLIEQAEADAEEIREAREREVESNIAQEREQELSSAKLEAKQERLAARRDVLEDVRQSVEDEIGSLSGDRREELTRTLLDAASEEFEAGADVSVYGRSDDESLLTSILEEYEGYSYAGEYECLGGVVVESDASRIRVTNTFDAILDDVWEANRRDISDRLFEDQ